MKILIVQGHPDRKSFTHANALNYYKKAKKMGHEVYFIDLSEDNFNPVLKYGYRKHMEDENYPKQVQKLISKADHITFFFPIWWSAEPAILKGFLDRVLTPHFAYQYKNGKTIKLLKDKTADVFTSSHGPSFFYKMFGNVLSRWKHLILGFCGIKMKHGYDLDNMDNEKDTLERRKAYMKKCAATILKK